MSVERKVGVVGLGYVGLPIALALSRVMPVVAFDCSQKRVSALRRAEDANLEYPKEALLSFSSCVSDQASDLKTCDFFIVAVPTPIDDAKQPDLSALASASETLGHVLKTGDIVVYESTVYPGVTEQFCLPILERVSGLQGGKDFFVGYSPERINPGDQEHTFENIIKVVAGQTEAVTQCMAEVYGSVVKAGIYCAPSIQVAEAAKVIENTQRDLNIALMNELAMLFHRLDIDTDAVLKAAGTKWNFLPFKPGLVGGHCIGVDPYYLTHLALAHDMHPEVILAGRRVNDGMGRYVAQQTVKALSQAGRMGPNTTVGILGLTFKENCPDLRNSKVFDVIGELLQHGISVVAHDPLADVDTVRAYEKNIQFTAFESFPKVDALVFAVPHRFYVEQSPQWFLQHVHAEGVFVDVKSVLGKSIFSNTNIRLWRL